MGAASAETRRKKSRRLLTRSSKLLCVATALILALGGISHATPVYLETTGSDFGGLLGGSLTAIDTPLITDFSSSNLHCTVVSQAFVDDDDNYLYLYQVNNTGSSGNDVVTRFTLTPFPDATTSVQVGYLTANVPAGFSLGDQAPLGADVDVTSGPSIGFRFPPEYPPYIPSSVIEPGDSSNVLYVESSLAPAQITGNVIPGHDQEGSVTGPTAVPEPGTLGLLALGGVGALLRRHRR